MLSMTLLSFGLLGWLVLLALFVIGVTIIVATVKAFFFALPAAVIALVVWLASGSEALVGIAFIAIAVLSILKRRVSEDRVCKLGIRTFSY
jgi:hypothetical protein